LSLCSVKGYDSLAVAVLNLATQRETVVRERAGFATYAPTGPAPTQGHLIYGRNGTLFAAPFDLARLETGSSYPVLDGALTLLSTVTSAAVSRSGTLAYLAGDHADIVGGSELIWANLDGTTEAPPWRPQVYAGVALAPDGHHAAVNIVDPKTMTADLWVYETTSGQCTRLTSGGTCVKPVWTPDGQRLIYSFRPGSVVSLLAGSVASELRSISVDGSGPASTLVPSSAWSPGLVESTSVPPQPRSRENRSGAQEPAPTKTVLRRRSLTCDEHCRTSAPMPRRRKPTDAELQILQVLWARGPSTVRDVAAALGREQAYTTILKLLQIMTHKELVRRDESARTHVYRAAVSAARTQQQIISDLVDRLFGGSAARLVLHALSSRKTSPEELAEIQALVDRHRGGQS
jgi:BlaI family transcriptional regulator, penicillinase repressor